jgi:hypothetical protein
VLAAEYLSIAQHAQQPRFDALLGRCGLGPTGLASAHSSEAYGPLLSAVRDAEARGLDIESWLPKLAAARSLAGAHDPIAVLHDRVERWAAAAGSKRQASAGLIAGLVPRALGVDDEDLARALVERDRAMERRARELAEQALVEAQAWARSLGPPLADPGRKEAWLRAVSTVAAFRGRWELGADPRPLGPEGAVTTLEGLAYRRSAPSGHRPRPQTGQHHGSAPGPGRCPRRAQARDRGRSLAMTAF